MNSPEKFCRLCLKEISDNGFKNLEQDAKDILSTLNLKVNLDISEEPVACTDCAGNIQKFYAFKVNCIKVESRLIPFVNPQTNEKTDLSEVYLKINEEKSHNTNICGLCMCEKPKHFSIQLNMLIEAEQPPKNLLESSVSEQNSNLIGDPMICKNCYDFLLEYMAFSTKCISIEEEIQNYVEVKGLDTKEKISLRNVQQFLKINVMKQEIDEISIIKHEIQGEHCAFMNHIPLKVDMKDESYMQADDLQVNKENGKIELDLIERDPKSMLDFTTDAITGIKKEDKELHQMDDIKQFCVSSSAITHGREKGDCFNETEIKLELNQQTLTPQNASKVKMYKCAHRNCTFETPDPEGLGEHVLIHKDRWCRCEYKDCLYQTKNRRHFERHTLIHKNPAEVTMYRCESDGCSFKTRFPDTFKKHRLVHKDPSEVTMYACDFENCSFETKRKSSLCYHKLTHQDLLDKAVYKCEHENCSFKTKYKMQLKSHVLFHKNPSREIITFKCGNENCTYETKYRSNFARHKFVHMNPSEIVMYKCENENCSYETKYKPYLKNHMIVHTEVRMHKCDYKDCTFETKHSYSLRKHKLIHKEKGYPK